MQTFPLFKAHAKPGPAKFALIVLAISLLLLSSALPAHAEAARTFNLVQEIPVVYSEYVPCAAGGAGEVLDFTGTLREFIHGTLTGNGLSIFSAKMVPNLTGVGQATGAAYQLVGQTGTTRVYTIDYNNQNEKETIVEHFNMVTPGEGTVYATMMVYHTIGNVNGDPVVTVEHVTVECR